MIPLTWVVLFGCLFICAITDLRVGLIFDRIVFPSLIAIIVVAACTREIVPSACGAIAGGSVMLGLRAVAGRNAMGLGDVKLACVIGAALGVIDGFIALGVAFVAGGAVASILLLLHRVDRKTRIPFAPFLAFGCAITVLCADLLSR